MRVSNNYYFSACSKRCIKNYKNECAVYTITQTQIKTPPISWETYKQSFSGVNRTYSSREIALIQNGDINQVIPSGQLTTGDVIQIFDNEIALIKPQDIKKITDTFSEEDRPLAMRALYEMSEFTNYNDLITLSKYTGKDKTILCDIEDKCHSRGILTTDLFNYLHSKDNKIDYPMNFIEILEKPIDNHKPIILLDEYTLFLLENDPKFRNLVKSKDEIGLLYPQGFINGINPFNQSSLSEIKKRTNEVVKTARQILATENLPIEAAVQKALNLPIQSKIKALGLGDRLIIVKNEDKTSAVVDEKTIAQRLAPKKMNKEELDEVIKSVPEESRQLVLKMLAMCAHVFSTRSLGDICKIHYKKLLALADELGIKHENIYFIQNYSNQSATTLIYQATNKIPFNKFTRRTLEALKGKALYSDKKLEKITFPPHSMLVNLDDNSGTGSQANGQLSYSSRYYNTKNKKSVFVMAPLVATDEAWEYCNKYNNPKDGYFLPGVVYSDKKFHDSLSEEELKRIKSIKKDTGYENIGKNFAFPHMSPDYNNLFFYTNIADKYTFSKSAIKTQELVDSYTNIDEYVY